MFLFVFPVVSAATQGLPFPGVGTNAFVIIATNAFF
jgi:hypothetical protein